MGIEAEDIAKVRDATDIVELITGHLQLRRVGRRWTGLCPFHNEKSPSFSVNAEDGLYYCFGCNKSGDAITFVREIEHLDFVGAVESLANKAGIQLRYTTKNEGANRRRRTKLTETLEKAVEWYHERLLKAPDAAPGRSYLRSRGFTGDQVRDYSMGWAPDGWDVLFQNLGVSKEVFVESGLGFVNRRNRVQDHFRGRVLFPIHDSSGAAVGFGGRVLPDGEGPKYKNSPESAAYAKSRLLYGLHRAKDSIVRHDEVIICEGYTDVMGFDQVDMGRAVATCGTSLTEDHVRMLKRFARRLVLAFDADAAGLAAAERIYEWEKAFEIDVAVARLPAGVDPADLAASDPDALRAAVDEAQPFLGFRVTRVLGKADLETAEGRARGAEQAIAVVREHPSPLVQDQYVMEIADTCRVDPDRLRPLLTGPLPSPAPSRTEGGAEQHPAEMLDAQLRDDVETQVLRVAIHRPEEFPLFIDGSMFSSPANRGIFAALMEHDDLHGAIEEAPPGIASALGQLAVVDEPEGESGPIIGQFLYVAATRRLRELQGEARRSGDVALAERTTGLQTLIPKVLDASFELTIAEQLVPWLMAARGGRG